MRIRLRECGISLLALCLALLLSCTAVLYSRPLQAQTKHVQLSEADTEKLREYADQPPERIKLYIKFIDERIAGIKQVLAATRPVPPDQTAQVHNLMDEFTGLVDELQDNLDGYADHHDDVRKALKQVTEACARWQEALKAAPPNSGYEFVRKTAIDATSSMADDSTKMLEEQNEYFKDKKKNSKQ